MLAAHLVTPSGHPGRRLLIAALSSLDEKFGIAHTSLLIETIDDYALARAANH